MFGKYVAAPGTGPFALTFLDYPPLGDCVVFNVFNPSLTLPFPLVLLDAGLNFNVNGPGGARTVSVLNPFLSPVGNYLVPGTYTISGTGGVNVGPFTTSVAIPPQPVWKDPSAAGILAPVDRSKGVTFTWTGGAPGSIIEIDGGSATDSTYTNGATFSCLVRADAGTLFVPPSILLALPAGNNGVFDFKPRTTNTAFSASGLDYGIVDASFDNVAIGSFL